MAYAHIFGPVPSRRLGLSLGVDLVSHKTCTLDCIYCECGKTTSLTITPGAYVSPASVKAELTEFLSPSPHLDFITFSGSGEPTLHDGIGEMASFIKTNYPEYKLALLTNGTLLHREDVRGRLLDMDVVIVSVDAGTGEAFQKVNRPHPGLNLMEFEAGLMSFRKMFKNSLWAEVFLVPDLNTSPDQLTKIREMLARIRPDRIQVNTLDRPGAEDWVAPLATDRLEKAASFLHSAELMPSSSRDRAQPGADDLSDRLLAAVQRRPFTIEDASRMLGMDESDVYGPLEEMVRKKTIQKVSMPRGIFYTADPA